MNEMVNEWVAQWESTRVGGLFILARLEGHKWWFIPIGCECGEVDGDGHTTEAAAQLCAARLRGGA